MEKQLAKRRQNESRRALTKKQMIKNIKDGQTVKTENNIVTSFKSCDKRLMGKTKYLTGNENLMVLIEEFVDTSEKISRTDKKVALVGLHTCGGLAVKCLQCYIKNTILAQFLCNVPCCYHMLKEQFEPVNTYLLNRNNYLDSFTIEINDNRYHTKDFDPFHQLLSDGFEFPLSSHLKKNKFYLGRNARMLATNAPCRMKENVQVRTN